MRNERHIRLLLFAMSVTLLLSCTHKELCYDHSHIIETDVVFDWSNAPGASPKSMNLYLFPKSGERPIRHDFVGHEGGRIRLNSGTYDIICLNSDTENIDVLDGSQSDSLRITTKNPNLSAMGYMRSAPRTGGERLSDSPEKVWSSYAADVAIEKTGTVVTLYPKPNTISCNVTIRNVENLKWVESIYGTLSGMSDGYFPQREQLCEMLSTIAFGCTCNPEEKTITGALSSFGHCPSTSNKHKLTIYVTLADGSSWEYDFDVIEQIHESPTPHDITIILDDIPIPKPVMNNGGFKPSVDEWDDIAIDINM